VFLCKKLLGLARGEEQGNMAGTGKGPEVVDLDVLTGLTAPHIDSFNFFVERGLALAVANLQPVEIIHPVTKVHLLNILFKSFI
jgi:hypothetical protein